MSYVFVLPVCLSPGKLCGWSLGHLNKPSERSLSVCVCATDAREGIGNRGTGENRNCRSKLAICDQEGKENQEAFNSEVLNCYQIFNESTTKKSVSEGMEQKATAVSHPKRDMSCFCSPLSNGLLYTEGFVEPLKVCHKLHPTLHHWSTKRHCASLK